VLERSVGEVAARVDVRPYAADTPSPGRDLFVASDLTPGLDGAPQRTGADHVLGISPASTSLAELTVRRPTGRALDLGTGCGVQALHLTSHAQHVVATDVNARALWLTRVNAVLNEVALDIREGSFWDPVLDDDPFDLVVTNPPFVISPAIGERLVYRDSGLPGDRVVEHLVRTAPRHLAPGGLCQVLGNWMVLEDQPWEERLAAWIDPPTGSGTCDAWVVERERVDLPTYVELWLKDAGRHPATGGDVEDYRRRYDTWLSWFDEQGAVAVGFGWLNLRATGTPGDVRIEQWPYEVAQPLGPEVAAHFDRVEWLRSTDDAGLLATPLRLRADVVQESRGTRGR
jgi:methylase of polypeptide subunit release factors